MERVDLKREFKHLYHASAKAITEVDVPLFRFLMIDGQGDPNTSPEYAAAIEALYSVAYTAKFMMKKAPQPLDYAVMPLEGLWWADDLSAFATGNRAEWKWTMMIMQPAFVPEGVIDAAISEVRAKKALSAIDRVRLEAFTEGRCAQVLHIGPYAAEGPTIERLHAYIGARAHRTGRHHEIYLSDPRRSDPRKWRTILRQPMR